MAADRFVEDGPSPYTPREREVIRLYALGLTWSETMADMGIGRNTISTYWRRIMEKTPEARCHMDVLKAIGWLHVPDIKVDAA